MSAIKMKRSEKQATPPNCVCSECGKPIPSGLTQWCEFGGLCSWYVPRALMRKGPLGPMVVLMLNDCSVGVYTSEAEATGAATEDWKKRELKWEEQGLTLGQSDHSGHRYTKWYYHQHTFSVNKEARLC